MGADMLVSLFYEPMDESFKPDWKKGHSHINKLTKKDLKNCEHLGDTAKEIKDILHEKLNNIKENYENDSRELTTLEFPPYKVYLTGGMSWGDDPSDIYGDISTLNDFMILEKVGFNEVPDYKSIVDIILKQTTVLPMLMSLHPDLDKLIAENLKL